MFENTSKKLKICAYVFFIAGLLQQIYLQAKQFIALECSPQFLGGILMRILNIAIEYFIVGLCIYGFAKIVERFENSHDMDE